MVTETVTLSKYQYQKLVEESNVLRDVVYELATTPPYGHSFTKAIYLARKTILNLGLKEYCQQQYRLPKE